MIIPSFADELILALTILAPSSILVTYLPLYAPNIKHSGQIKLYKIKKLPMTLSTVTLENSIML